MNGMLQSIARFALEHAHCPRSFVGGKMLVVLHLHGVVQVVCMMPKKGG